MFWWRRLRFHLGDHRQRRIVICEWARYPSSRATTFLVHLLRTQSDHHREILQALGASHDPRAVDSLLWYLASSASNEQLLVECLKSLSRFSHVPQVASKIVAAMELEKRPVVQSEVAMTLGRWFNHDKSSIPLLARWLRTSTTEQLRSNASAALNSLGYVSCDSGEQLLIEMGTNQYQALAARGPSVIQSLQQFAVDLNLSARVLAEIDWSDSSEVDRRQAAVLLRDGIMHLIACHPGWRVNRDEIKDALTAISRIDSPLMLGYLTPPADWKHLNIWETYVLRSFPVSVLVHGLSDSNSLCRRYAAEALAFSTLDRAEIVRALAARHIDTDIHCRQTVAATLLILAKSPVTPDQCWLEVMSHLAAFTRDADPVVRERIVDVLSEITASSACDGLILALDDPSINVVTPAIYALAKWRDRRVLHHLGSVSARLGGKDVLKAVLHCVGVFDAHESLEMILKIALNSESELAGQAQRLSLQLITAHRASIETAVLERITAMPSAHSWTEHHEWMSESSTHDELHRDVVTYTTDISAVQSLAIAELGRRSVELDARGLPGTPDKNRSL